MANAEKVVDYVAEVLSSLIPKPGDILFKPMMKPVGDALKKWLSDRENQTSLLEAARNAENDFRVQAREKLGNDRLAQVVASFPLYNGELFQAALQSLPSHFDETFLETHLSDDLTKYWSGEFTPKEIRAGVALYLDCLRIQLLGVKDFADVITGLAILRTDRRTEEILIVVNQILEKLSDLSNKDLPANIFRPLNQLPQPPADFTGREELREQLLKDFAKGKGATITGQAIHGLVGMGGIGKTALGLVVAGQIAKDYPDAQIFLDLKGTTTPLSAAEIMRHVILSFEPTMDLRALDEANLPAAYQSVLHGKKALLFLDNARSSAQVAPLRPPDTCAMLVTSRWSFGVPGLHNRRLDVMSQENATRFLLELCPRIGSHAAELAKACGYLPLALRIAGSFLGVNEDRSVEDYIAQLNDRKHRLSTFVQSREEAELKTEPDLLATFELSYGALAEEDQKRWRMLGVFPTSFDLHAARDVWELGDIETAKLLSLLKRYSLLDYDEGSNRYYLHDLLADYALEQMNSDEKIAAQIAHSVHYSKLLTVINDMFLKGGDSIEQSLNIYDTEWININLGQQISVDYLEDNHDAVLSCNNYALQGSINGLRQKMDDRIRWLEDGLKASKILGNKQFIGGHLGNLGVAYSELGQTSKAIGFYTQQLAITQEVGNRQEEGAVLGNLGVAYSELGNYQMATRFHERALEIAQETKNRRNESFALTNLGTIYAKLGDVNKAIEFYQLDLNITREIGDLQGESTVLGNLGVAYAELKETSMAVEFYNKCIEVSRKIGYRHEEGRALGNLGVIYAKSGDLNKAIDYFQEFYEIAHEISDRLGEVRALEDLGVAFTDLGNFSKAVEVYIIALEIDREIGDPKRELTHLRSLGTAYAGIGTLDVIHKAIEVHERQLYVAREVKDPDAEGSALGSLGFLKYNIGEKEIGIMLAKQALEIFKKIGVPALRVNAIRDMLRQWGVEEKDRKKRKRRKKTVYVKVNKRTVSTW